LPRAEYDEWYIFRDPADLGVSHLAENVFEVAQEQGHVSVFVNYGFALAPPERTSLTDLSGRRWSGFAQSLTWQITTT